jgi:hypothetical protein
MQKAACVAHASSTDLSQLPIGLQARLQAAEAKRLRLLEDIRRRAAGRASRRASRARDALRAGSDQTRDKRMHSRSLNALQLDDLSSFDQMVSRTLA